MKFLEYTSLSRVNSFLGRVNLGEYLIEGVLEAYSCKLAGVDKKLSRSLEQDVMDELATSPVLCTSPVGPLTNSASRRTLIYLILTMNHMYPDYDFSMLRAHHFTKEHSLNSIKQKVDYLLVEAGKAWQEVSDGAPLLEALWAAVDEAIELVDCDIYSYKAELDGDPFGEKGSIWAFNYFLYNKKLKRVLYFSCRYLRKAARDESSPDDLFSDEEEDFARDMDMED